MQWAPSSWDSCMDELANTLSRTAIRNPLSTDVPKVVTDKLMDWQPPSWNHCVDELALALHNSAIPDPLFARGSKSEAHDHMDWESADGINDSIDQLTLALSKLSIYDPLESVETVKQVVVDDLMDIDASDAACERCECTIALGSIRQAEQTDDYMDVDVPEGARLCARCECLMA